ncbi:glycosyltransferase family 39 protein [bacterium]|nr:glycosyltransferase family 39 protein [bacterium]
MNGLNQLAVKIKSHPEWILILISVVLFALGQERILNMKFIPGMMYTFLAIVVLLVYWRWHRSIRTIGSDLRRIIDAINHRLKSPEKVRQDTLATPQPSRPALSSSTGITTSISVSVAETEGVPSHDHPKAMNFWTKFSQRVIVIPKKVFFSIAVFFIIAGQPFFMLDKISVGILLVIVGAVLLFLLLFQKQEAVILGTGGFLLKLFFLLLPGMTVLIVGNVFLVKWVNVHFIRESIGLVLNAIGVFLLYSLFPRKLKDPEPDNQTFLDSPTGESRKSFHVGIKIGWVIIAIGLYWFAKSPVSPQALLPATLLSLSAWIALLFSFPWKRQSIDRVLSTEQPLKKIFMKCIRLAGFGLAFYLAYKGQKLISVDQLAKGLHCFLWASIALILVFREPASQWVDTMKEKNPKWYWEFLALAVILTIATWIRLYLLDTIPYGIECDEAGSGVAAMQVLNGEIPSLTVAKEGGRPLFMLLPRVLSFKLFGLNPVGLKFMSAVWGVFGVLAIYIMARHMFGFTAAVGAATLMAFSRWHIHFSRYGWSNMLMILLITLAFYFFMKGMETRKKSMFLWSGVAMGLCVQTETSARLLPIIAGIIFLYVVLTQRRFLVRHWKPLVVLMLGVWLAGAAIFSFWVQKPQYLMKRVQEVSLFSEDVNAPKNIWEGMIRSSKLSFMQLNSHGDYRGRHNGGLSGEPMLDFWSAILFALGAGLSLYYWRRMRYFILLVLFVGFMSGSVFSLEAPQSHRAFGIVPVVFLMIAAFFDRSRRLLKDVLGRLGIILGVLAFLAMLVPIAKTNYSKYFDTQPAFDANCTAAAKYMGGDSWQKAQHYVLSAFLWMGHPPFLFYAPKLDASFKYRLSEIVPFHSSDDQDVLYTSILEYPPVMESIKWFYPEGIDKEEKHPKYGLMFKSWGVSRESILKKQGLTARYYENTTWQGKPILQRKDKNLDLTITPETWPLSGSGSVAWEGTIFIPHEGEYTFYLYGQSFIEATIGKRIKLQSNAKQEAVKSIWLSGGLHPIRVRAKYFGKSTKFLMAWSCREEVGYYLGGSPYKKRFFKQAIPLHHLFTYPQPVGLLETLYANDRWEGKPIRQFVEPLPFFYWHSTPHGFSPPLSYLWEGYITVEKAGQYQFDIMTSNFSQLEIDGEKVIVKGNHPNGEKNQGQLANPVFLTPGRHTLRMLWSASNGWYFKFFWKVPGGKKELVPAWVLSPAEENRRVRQKNCEL